MSGFRFAFLILCFFSCFVPCRSEAQSLSRVYKLLNAGEYAEAKEKLDALKSNDDPAVAFAYARYFFETDNPNHQPDSAKAYVMRSAQRLGDVVKKSKIRRNNSLGVRSFTVTDLNERINQRAYDHAADVNTVDAWNHFLNLHSDATQFNEARTRRNRLAFEQARDNRDPLRLKKFLDDYPDASDEPEARSLYEQLLYMKQTGDSTWRAYKRFMDEQPNSPYIASAKANYERLLFADKTSAGTAEAYESFITEYPDSPYRTRAEDSLYARYAKPVSRIDALTTFIQRFPSNRNIAEAWEKLFWLSTNGSDSSVHKFLALHPRYPRRNVVQKAMQRAGVIPVVFSDGDRIGYKDSLTNDVLLPALFWDLGEFSEGLVAATKEDCDSVNCRYGYYDMSGRQIIAPRFSEANPFHAGKAVVGVGYCSADSCRYGVISKAGDFLVPPVYDDLSFFSNGLALVRRDTLYGFIDSTGKEIIPVRFNDAREFGEGLAAVLDTAWWFIDTSGKPMISGTFTNAGVFSEGLCAAANDKGLWGYIDRTGTWIVKPQFTDAGPFTGGKAKVNTPASRSSTAKPDKERWIDRKGNFIKATR